MIVLYSPCLLRAPIISSSEYRNLCLRGMLFSFLGMGWDWVHLARRPLTGLFYQPRMMDDECRAVGGMRIARGNRSTRRKSAPMSLCPPQNPHDLGSNRGRRCGKPVTNRLSYGKALFLCLLSQLLEIMTLCHSTRSVAFIRLIRLLWNWCTNCNAEMLWCVGLHCIEFSKIQRKASMRGEFPVCEGHMLQ
jgi:hypothetical protein